MSYTDQLQGIEINVTPVAFAVLTVFLTIQALLITETFWLSHEVTNSRVLSVSKQTHIGLREYLDNTMVVRVASMGNFSKVVCVPGSMIPDGLKGGESIVKLGSISGVATELGANGERQLLLQSFPVVASWTLTVFWLLPVRRRRIVILLVAFVQALTVFWLFDFWFCSWLQF